MAKDRRRHRSGLEVAVIGMAGRFPGAPSVGALWRNLRAGREGITFFTDEELAAAGMDPELRRDPRYVPAKGYLADAELFDAEFFAIGAREAEILDPQHRLFLECAWEAIESAGYDLARYSGWIGVYAGTAMSTYYLANLRSRPDLLESVGHLQVSLANDKDYLATRTSYKLGLEGPSLSVQTACSTSLVAVHLACQALLRGECDMALAGGASIGVPLRAGYLYQEGGILSPDGHTRTFDADARGCVGGNGVGVVLLKKLDEALADGDVVHAVIKGSAVNNDGALKIGYTAPRIDGQAKVIRMAHIVADVPSESITYVEAHGTATELGDPAEIAALTQAFAEGTGARGFCAIASVKSNLGHLDAAAGVTGLIKTVLALEHGEIPPSLHFRRPNPQIDFAETPFYVAAELQPWESREGPRRAGVSAFGIGGTNVHTVLEEAPPRSPVEPSREWQLLLLSARTSLALERSESRLASHLESRLDASLADVAFTLKVGRKEFAERRFLVCRTLREAVEGLARRGADEAGVCDPQAAAPRVAFLLPGQGAQQIGMASALYRGEPGFRRPLDRCAELLRPHLGIDFRNLLYPAAGRRQEAAARLRQTALAQPVLFAVEFAMARLWEEWGIRPRALAGHSLGELVAACLAGVLRLEDALRVVARRGALMQDLPEGAMLSVPLPEAEVVGRLGGDLDLAAVNGPAACVVSGEVERIRSFQRTLEREGVATRLLDTSHAFHSAAMEAVRAPLVDEMARVELRPPQVPFLSNLTGTWIEPQQATDPEYWGEHLRRPVRFSAGLERLLASPERILLEVGPWGGLTPLTHRHPKRDPRTPVLASSPSPRDSTPGDAHLLRALGRLWLAGVRPDWKGFYRREGRRRVALPTYPFERRRYWVDAAADARAESAAPAARREAADWFYAPIWKRLPPALPEAARQPGPWLLFLDDLALGRDLAARLAAGGEAVATVTAGSGFGRLGDGAYSVDPGRREDYERLLEALCSHGAAPTQIVHLWSLDGGGAAPEPVLRQRGFTSLILLAQAIGEQMAAGGFGVIGERAITLSAVSDQLHEVTGEESLRPEKATLLGPLQVIPQEYPNLHCRSLDLLLPPTGSLAWGRLVDRLAEDLAAPDTGPLIAYRGSHRWIPTFEPLRLETPRETCPLRPGGCYLITGGLGGIGLVVARGLAQAVAAKLVLIGRSALPARDRWRQEIADGGPAADQLGRLLEIEELGGELLVLQADVADEAAMRRVLDEAVARFGRIDGVFHAAGLPGGTLIQRQTPETAAAVLSPKVEGTLLLDRLLGQADLDFFALFSSHRAFLGGGGQADYCAANAFLQSFAVERSRRGRSTIAIAWDGWREVGMGWRAARESGREETDLAGGLSNDEGWNALLRVLAAPTLTQVVVSVRDFPRLLEHFRRQQAEAVLSRAAVADLQRGSHPRPPLSTPFVAPRNEAEQILADVWSQLLGVAPIGVDDNFFELGGDSVVSLQIVSRATQAGLRLTPRQVFQHQTIAGLAAVAGSGGSPRARQGLVTGEVPLTPIQRWFFDQDLADPHHYNQSLLLRCGERLDAARLEQAVAGLLAHHDALRLRFERTEEGWRQTNAGLGGPSFFLRVDLSALRTGDQPAAVTAVASRLQTTLDLARGPLGRVALLDLGEGRAQRLMWTLHHLAVDAISWRILLQDLQTLYGAAGADAGPAVLPPKTTSYRQWALRLRDYAGGEELLRQSDYWLEQPWPRVRPLPVDHPEADNTWDSARTETMVLDAETTRALTHGIPRTVRAQVQDLLLTALAQTFRTWTGEPLLLVELEGHGRDASFDEVDLSRTVGWFTNLYPVLLDLEGTRPSPGEALKAVKEQLRKVPDHGLGFGLLRTAADRGVAERLACLPQAEVLFLYTGLAERDGDSAPSLYTRAPEPHGPNQSPRSERQHLLDLTVSVEDGRLFARWTYGSNLWQPGAIPALVQRYEQTLRELIRHCLSGEVSGLTPSDYPLAQLAAGELELLLERFAAGGWEGPIEDIYPLSPIQDGLLYHTLYEPGSGVYVTQIHWTLRGNLDTSALRRAWLQVVQRHAALRTAFVWERLRRPLQVVLRTVELPWEELDWRHHDDREERFETLLRSERGRGFDVEHPPLMRLHLVRLETGLTRLLWAFHHLLIDGWAVHVIFNEIIAGYAALQRGLEPPLGEVRPYRDYIAWLQRQDLARAEAFWRRTLAGFKRPVPLPGVPDRPAGGGSSEARQIRHSRPLPATTAAALRELGREHQLTLNTIVQGAWALLLSSHAQGRRDVVFGSVLSGRPESLEGVESMVGLFINTLPVRVRIDPGGRLLPWLRQLQEEQAEMREFEYSPLVEVHGWSDVPRGQRLFNTILVFESYPASTGADQAAGAGLEIVAAGGSDQNSYPLTVTVYPRQEIVLEIVADPGRFEEPAVGERLEELTALLVRIAGREADRLGDLLAALDAARRQARARAAERRHADNLEKLRSLRPTAASLEGAHR